MVGDSSSLGPSSYLTREVSGRESSLSTRKEKVVITCLGMLYSPIIMQSVEGQACPDATQFLMAGTQVGVTVSVSAFRTHDFNINESFVHGATAGFSFFLCLVDRCWRRFPCSELRFDWHIHAFWNDKNGVKTLKNYELSGKLFTLNRFVDFMVFLQISSLPHI